MKRDYKIEKSIIKANTAPYSYLKNRNDNFIKIIKKHEWKENPVEKAVYSNFSIIKSFESYVEQLHNFLNSSFVFKNKLFNLKSKHNKNMKFENTMSNEELIFLKVHSSVLSKISKYNFEAKFLLIGTFLNVMQNCKIIDTELIEDNSIMFKSAFKLCKFYNLIDDIETQCLNIILRSFVIEYDMLNSESEIDFLIDDFNKIQDMEQFKNKSNFLFFYQTALNNKLNDYFKFVQKHNVELENKISK